MEGFMAWSGYEVGGFGDLRLQKGGPCCTARWLSDAALAFAGLRVAVQRRFNSTDFCGTRK
jgi:hypothetical protein